MVKSTRLSVEFILSLFAAGWTELQVLESYPTLTTEPIRAIFAFAAECMQDQVLYTLLQFEDRFTVVEREQVRQRPLP